MSSRPGSPSSVPDPPPDLFRRLRLAIALCVAVIAVATVVSLVATDDASPGDEDAAGLALLQAFANSASDDDEASGSIFGDEDAGNGRKVQDASAKSDARNTVSQVESCFTTTEDYARCSTPEQLGLDGAAGIDVDRVAVTATAERYAVTATSESGNTFTIDKTSAGVFERRCTAVDDDGGCDGGTW